MIVDVITPAMKRKTTNKFKKWDEMVDSGKFAANDPEAWLMLDDPAVYAYAFLKDENENPMKFAPYQDLIGECRHDFTAMNDNRFLIFRAANQIGKSFFLIANAIFHVMTEDNINVVLVSKSLPQYQHLLREIKAVLNRSAFGSTWKEDIGDTANTTQITFERDNGKTINRIICAPAGEGLLGYPVHYLYLDEADFYEDAKTFFYKVALPRTNKTKGQIVIFTNPDPEKSSQVSLLYELWHGDLFKKKFHFNFLDAPWNTREEYDKLKRSMPSYITDSTLDGNFPPDGGGFFTGTEIKDMLVKDWKNELPIVDRPVYIGMDLAKARDSTVIAIGVVKENEKDKKIQDIEIRYMHKFPPKTDYNVVVDKLADIVSYYSNNFKGVAAIGFDATGVGKAVEDIIRTKNIKATPITFTSQSKSKMYANFKLLAEQRRLKIVHDHDCELQLAGLVFDKTQNGYLKIAHAKEDIHDDYPDTIAILLEVALRPSSFPVSLSLVNNRNSSLYKEQNEENSKFQEIWDLMELPENDL